MVKNAKVAGEFDLGIKTLSGQEVKLIGEPRMFRFGGLNAPDEVVFLYKVKCDTGIHSTTALQIYQDAKNEEKNTPKETHNNWTKRGRRFQLSTGFYIDARDFLEKTPKVFLIVKRRDFLNEKALVVRPNVGKKLQDEWTLMKKIESGALRMCAEDKITRAIELWDREYNMADMPSDSKYQFSCVGRHRESIVLTGHVVPVSQTEVVFLL